MLEKLSNAIAEASDFRKMVEAKHADKAQLDRIEGLLVDILCVLNMEFYIRPKTEREE